MQPAPFTCSRCNAVLPPGASQCPNCGLVFPGPVPYPGAPAPFVHPPPTARGKSGAPVIAIVVGAFAVGCLPVVAIFAAILFPVFAKAREKAREAASASNLRIIGVATLQYEQDNNNDFPPMDSMEDFETAIAKYMPPSSSSASTFTEPGYGPYTLNQQLSNQPITSVSDPGSTFVAEEAHPHSDGEIEILYADGVVQTSFANQNSNFENGGGE